MDTIMPSDFDGQFIIGSRITDTSNMDIIKTPNFEIGIFGNLPAVNVFDSSNKFVGLILGFPVCNRRGKIITDSIYCSMVLTDSCLENFIEFEIYSLSGSYVFILDSGNFKRIYLDACGTLPVVFDPIARIVGATSLLLLDCDEVRERFRNKMYERLDVSNDGWFPGLLTAHRGINRLMPNFYLDLDDFMTYRHWPNKVITETKDPIATCEKIRDEVTNNIASILNSGTANASLTAGNETRMLLACAKPNLGKIKFFTVDGPDSKLDKDCALTLASRFNLCHRILNIKIATKEKQLDWHARTGYTIGGPHIITHPTTHILADRPYYIGGLGGEIGRGFFWRNADTNISAYSADEIWPRMGMPVDKEAIEAIGAWRKTLPDFNGLFILDLAYHELRMGCWGFATAYATRSPKSLHPIISRRIFELMYSLPPDWRRQANGSNRMIQTIIQSAWPELLDLPINRYGDYRDALFKIRRAINNPKLVVRKIRKRYA